MSTVSSRAILARNIVRNLFLPSLITAPIPSRSFHRAKITMTTNKVCLIVIDGWGVSDKKEGNAIWAAETPVMDSLAASDGQALTLDASGLAVGLPDGLMGNSEVGHLNIGAGRVLYQDIVRINMDVDNHSIQSNPNFVEACESAKVKSGGRLHLLGLVSDGGVHAHINHLYALLQGAKENGVPSTFIQFFGDGRDTLPNSGVIYVQQVLDKIKELNYGSLASIIGRYYAMDRDKRWERIKIAYDGLTAGVGEKSSSDAVIDLIKKRYAAEGQAKETDEFLKPIILNEEGIIRENDTLVFIDYRADRMRQITDVFGLGINSRFEPVKEVKALNLYTMTQYNKEFPFKNLYPPVIPKNVLAEAVSSAGKLQFHCAETEKYAHVTFFFNGGQETSFPGEDRQLVPSPKVATYDLQPEMNAAGVAEEMCKALTSNKYDFIMCNFANPDMVGHTGKYEPAVKACAATDVGIGRIRDAANAANYVLLVTADHGNAEQMFDDKGGPFTAHTNNRVPFLMTGSMKFKIPDHNSALCDVAPTVLSLMGIAQPSEMTGKSLLA